MRRLLRHALLITMVLCAFPRPAAAPPMVTDLATVRVESPTVVIAKLADIVGPPGSPTAYLFDVERALVGSATPGPLQVSASWGAAHLAKGSRVVAFLDVRGAFKYVATLEVGPSLEKGVLLVQGFYSWNAHLVTPGVMTLAQLDRYLRTGALEYEFVGKLHSLAPGAPAGVPAAIDLTVWRDEIAGTSSVSGMPALQGWSAGPSVEVGDGVFGDLAITWKRGWPRPLLVEGTPTGVDPATGAILTRFWVETPVALTEPELQRYVADPKVVATYHALTLSFAGGAPKTVAVGVNYGQRRNDPAAPLLAIDEISLAPARYLKGPGVSVDLDPRAPAIPSVDRGDTELRLVQELSAGPIGCSVRWSGGPPARCSLALGSTELPTR